MPAILVTGKMGQGKTHFVMKKYVNEAAKQGRPIYTNIDGCTLDVHPIPVNEMGELDWTLTEEADPATGQKGALIVYDEAQRQVDKNGHRYFAWAARQKISDREVIREIEYHRHSGRDIIFITQSPKLLHLHLLELINEHYHCTRLRNEKRSQISLWRSWQEKPDSLAAIERAEDVFFESFDDNVFKQYKSTTEVTDGKTRTPKYFYKLGAIAFICIGGAVALFANIFNHFGDGHRIGQDSINKTLEAQKALEQRAVAKTAGAQIAVDPKANNLDVECRKGANVEKPECVQWFNNLTKQGASIPAETAKTVSVSYDPNKPFDTSIQKSLAYQPTAKPIFSGCMKKGNRYIAYTQQGTILHEVSQADCKKVVEHGDRPFNYFKQDITLQSLQVQNDSESDLSSDNSFKPSVKQIGPPEI